MSILDKFVEHAAQLDNLSVSFFLSTMLLHFSTILLTGFDPFILRRDDGWKAFMQLFLQSVQPIVLEPGSFKSNRTGSADGDDGEGRGEIPSAFVEEIEDLRTRVEELSDEVRPPFHVTLPFLQELLLTLSLPSTLRDLES
jgi:hypothetical protein